MPIAAGIALTFVIIAVFKKNFGGIALGFGATTSGIAIDYTIHYISKINLYPDLKTLRKKIGYSLILGYLTTIISFVLLPFSNILSLQEIALFGIVSITACFLFSWFVLQNIIKPENTTYKVIDLNLPIPGKKPMMIFALILPAIFILSFFVRLETSFNSLDRQHKALDRKAAMIKNYFNQSTDSIFLAFEGESRDELLKKSRQAYMSTYNADLDLRFVCPSVLSPGQSTINRRIQFIRENFNKSDFIDAINNSSFTGGTFDPWINMMDKLERSTVEGHPAYLEKEIERMFTTLNGKQYLLIHIGDREKVNKIKQVLTRENIEQVYRTRVQIEKNPVSGSPCVFLASGRTERERI